MFVQITDILLPNEVTVFKDTTIDKETFYTAKMPKKGGQRRLEIADILPNCVQGGAKRNSPVASQWFERLKIVPEMQKIA